MTFKEIVELKMSSYTIPEVRRMLGLGKTDSNWLVHQGKFESVQIQGRYYINKKSFEKWYANQIKYKKVDGSPPGIELRSASYSVPDLASLLEVSDSVIYDRIQRGDIEVYYIDDWMRISKGCFERWYSSQDSLRTKADKAKDAELEQSSLSLTDTARKLGIHRNSMYSLVQRHPECFDIIVIAGRKRITKESFEKWYGGQSRHKIAATDETVHSKESLDVEQQGTIESGEIVAPAVSIENKEEKKYYTVDEIQRILSLSKRDSYSLVQSDVFAVVKVGKRYLIPKEGFDEWLNANTTREE